MKAKITYLKKLQFWKVILPTGHISYDKSFRRICNLSAVVSDNLKRRNIEDAPNQESIH